MGYESGGERSGAEIQAFTNEVWAGDRYGTSLTFSTVQQTTIVMRERMRITSTGLVGIGTDNPSTELHISGAGADDTAITIETSDKSVDVFPSVI